MKKKNPSNLLEDGEFEELMRQNACEVDEGSFLTGNTALW